MATIDSIVESLREAKDIEPLQPLVQIAGSATVQSGYYADTATSYDGIDDDFNIAKLDVDPHSQFELDVSPTVKAVGTGSFLNFTVRAINAFPTDFLNRKLGASGLEVLYLGAFIRVVNPRDQKQAQAVVKLDYVSAMSETAWTSDLSNVTNLSLPTAAAPYPNLEVTLVPDADGVCESFIGTIDQKGIKSKFYSPAMLKSVFTDDAGTRVHNDIFKAKLQVKATAGADLTIVHCFSTTPSAFAKGAAVLFYGTDLSDWGIDGSIANAQLSVARGVTASNIWEMMTGGVEDQNFLKLLFF
jgi:hypothetical protein